jgi:V/A-type H+-transporting ATPase subunit E
MSLKHILNTIELKTQEEIDKILKQAEEKKQTILQEAQEEAQKIKERVKLELEQKTQEKIVKVKRRADSLVKNKILFKKREILDNIFTSAAQKLAKQENKLNLLYKKLIANLPDDKNAKILTSAATAPLIQELTKQAGLNYPIKTGLQEDGFKFISPSIEVDNRLNRLIDEIRDQCEIEVAKLLFE